MAHDVFISHSSKNKSAADAICHSLERARIKCWIAPRDISPGAEYAEQLLTGIKNCCVFLLIFSKESNVSSAVAKEIESAVRYEKTIIPCRIDRVEMRASLEYYLLNLHWLDAYPDEEEFETLVKAVQTALGKTVAESAVKQENSQGAVLISKKNLIFGGAAIAIVAALVFVLAMNLGNDTVPVYDGGVYNVEVPPGLPPTVPVPKPTPPVQETEPPIVIHPQETPPPTQETPPNQQCQAFAHVDRLEMVEHS